jgi:lipooligosaccharide transport system permease protein
MFLFAGVFFPLERLPRWLQVIAWFMPLHHGAELMRNLMTFGRPVDAGMHALWLAVVSLMLLLVPAFVLRRRLVK